MQHDTVLAHHLPAHDAVHMMLQGADFARQIADTVKGHDADLGVLQRHRAAGVAVVDYPVQANDFTGHLKTRHLFAATFGIDEGLEAAGADGKQGFEGFAVAKQRGAALDLAACGHHLVDAGQLPRAHALRHAQLTQVAVGTNHFHGLRVHGVQARRGYRAHGSRGLRR